MPPKIRELIRELEKMGFSNRGGKGSHRNFIHPDYPLTVTVSGKEGDDAKPYQTKAIAKVKMELGGSRKGK